MKTFLLLVFLATTAILPAQNIDIELKNISNEWVNLNEELAEKITVIDFWASWCKPCVDAMPKMNYLHEKYKDKGVKVIGINVDSPRNQSKVRPLVRSLNINYPILMDSNEELIAEFNVSVLPTLFILDAQGKLVYTHEGFAPGDEKIIEKEIENLL